MQRSDAHCSRANAAEAAPCKQIVRLSNVDQLLPESAALFATPLLWNTHLKSQKRASWPGKKHTKPNPRERFVAGSILAHDYWWMLETSISGKGKFGWWMCPKETFNTATLRVPVRHHHRIRHSTKRLGWTRCTTNVWPIILITTDLKSVLRWFFKTSWSVPWIISVPFSVLKQPWLLIAENLRHPGFKKAPLLSVAVRQQSGPQNALAARQLLCFVASRRRRVCSFQAWRGDRGDHGATVGTQVPKIKIAVYGEGMQQFHIFHAISL